MFPINASGFHQCPDTVEWPQLYTHTHTCCSETWSTCGWQFRQKADCTKRNIT